MWFSLCDIKAHHQTFCSVLGGVTKQFIKILFSAKPFGRLDLKLLFFVILSRSPSERSGKGCCGQWFAGPPLRAVIFVVALGGLACALGGAALGATGLAGPPTSHFTAALLMTGIYMNSLLFI